MCALAPIAEAPMEPMANPPWACLFAHGDSRGSVCWAGDSGAEVGPAAPFSDSGQGPHQTQPCREVCSGLLMEVGLVSYLLLSLVN